MKKIIIALALVPTLSFASIYSCSGQGFSLELMGNPVEMKVAGNGLNVMAQNVQVSETFDTVVTANIKNPAQSIKLSIKDSKFGNPGDRFNASLLISSALGAKKYSGFVCIRGNE